MRALKEFKNIHKDEDIYVMGAGKSCDYVDNSFFNNKTLIGVNQTYKKIHPTYLVRKETQLLDKILQDKALTNVIHFISKGSYGGNNSINLNHIKNNYDHLYNVVVFNHNFNELKIHILPRASDTLIVSWTTFTTARHLAAYMGAKNIILVGHDCGTLDDESFFTGYHTKETISIAWGEHDQEEHYKVWLSKIEKSTKVLKLLLTEEYRCNILSLNPFINFGLEGHKYDH